MIAVVTQGRRRTAVLDELIQKISDQTGQPTTTVAPVVGALLAHLGDVLPAPLAHQLAIFLGIHQEGAAPDAGSATSQPGMGGLLGEIAGGLGGGGAPDARVAGATALINVAQSLLSGFLASKR
jgi:hypothetical protein